MIKLEVRTRLDPLVLRPASSCIIDDDGERTIPVVGVVSITTDKSIKTGGVTVGWDVSVAHRVSAHKRGKRGMKGQGIYGKPVILRHFELDVKGEMVLEEGVTE
jgi:hypothetical protein